MTTQTSLSAEKSSNHRFFNGKFFKFQLKTGWPLLVVLIVLFTLSMIVPTVKIVSELSEPMPASSKLIEWACQFLYGLGIVNVVLSMLVGLLCGLTAMRYVNNKVSVNFYHSLPLRCEALFTTSTLYGFVYYVISFAVGLGVMFTVFAIKVGHLPELIRPVLLTLEYGILFFFLVYAMTLFAASLTGTGFMRLVGAAYVIFLPLVVYVAVTVMSSLDPAGNNLIDIDYYLSEDFLIPLCCPLRFIRLITSDIDGNVSFVGAFGKETAIVLVTAIVFYGLSFLLYCLRRSESASQPVVWSPARFVFKYATIFIGGTLLGMIFEVMFGSNAWMIFGIAFGSLITFMLTNGILHKSARAIFKGLRGFAIYAGAMAVVVIVLYADAFGMFVHIPSPSYVSKVDIFYDYRYYAEYSGDFAKKATKLLSAAEKYDDNVMSYGYSYGVEYARDGLYVVEKSDELEPETVPDELEGIYGGRSLDYKSVRAVFHTKLGIPYAVEFTSSCEGVYELAEFLRDTGKLEPDISKCANPRNVSIELGLIDESEERIFDTDILPSEVAELVEMLSDPAGLKGDSPRIGVLSVYSNNYSNSYISSSWYSNTDYTITAADYEFLNELMIFGEEFESEEDVLWYLIERMNVDYVYVQESGADKYEKITDTSDIFEVVSSLENVDEYHYADSPLCRVDHTTTYM